MATLCEVKIRPAICDVSFQLKWEHQELEVPRMQNCGCSRDPLRACGPREVRTPHCALEAGHKRFGAVVLCEALQ